MHDKKVMATDTWVILVQRHEEIEADEEGSAVEIVESQLPPRGLDELERRLYAILIQ